MGTVYQTWKEVVSLFKERKLPRATYRDLYEEEYILHRGAARLSKTLRLDDHEYRNENPWIKAGGRPEYEGVDGAVTGYVIDGDLEVAGNIINGDEGSPALVVLGDLRAKNLWISGDTKLIVKGDLEVETLVGGFTDKLLIVEGNLRAKVLIFTDEFSPDRVGGALEGYLAAPSYYDPETDENLGSFIATNVGATLADLVVPEVRITAKKAAKTGVPIDAGVWVDRLAEGLPVLLPSKR